MYCQMLPQGKSLLRSALSSSQPTQQGRWNGKFSIFFDIYFHRRRWRSYILNTRWSWPNICGSGSYLGSASRLVGYQTWSSSFIICIYWYWTWTVGAFGVVVRRRVHGGGARGRVSGGREEDRRKERNAFVILLCCVSVDVCSYVRTYGSAESIVACVSFIHSFSFFLLPSSFFLFLLLLSPPDAMLLWILYYGFGR